jgi:hypothetical protein
MLFRLGRYELWMERTGQIDWKPYVWRTGKATLVWFLNIHLIFEK